jgi:peptidyl-prolyl cis-trans isomerase C
MEAKILAAVGGQSITEAEVEQFLAALGPRGDAYRSPEGKAAILEELINRKLFLMEAQRNLFEAEAAFKAQLKQAKESLLINYAIEKAVSGARVKEEEIVAFYEENKDKMGGGDTVNASHILVETEEEALRILDEIKGGLAFEEAARKYSSCPSKEEGGNLGDFGRGQMVPEFEQAAFAMAEGELSAPVKTQFGYHLIRLNSKKTGEVTPLSEVRERIEAELMRRAQQTAYQSKVNQLKILFPVDKY